MNKLINIDSARPHFSFILQYKKQDWPKASSIQKRYYQFGSQLRTNTEACVRIDTKKIVKCLKFYLTKASVLASAHNDWLIVKCLKSKDYIHYVLQSLGTRLIKASSLVHQATENPMRSTSESIHDCTMAHGTSQLLTLRFWLVSRHHC